VLFRSISAKDKGTGREQSIKIEASSGLSDEDIKRMRAEAEANADADKKKMEEVEKINKADSLIFQTERQLKEYGDKIPADKKQPIEDALAELKVVFEAKAGAVLPQAIDMGPNGFSVVLVGEKRPVEAPKFEQVKAELSKALMAKYAVEVISKIKKQAGVEVTGLDGKPIVEKTPEQMKEDAEKGVKKPEVDLSKLDETMVIAKFKDGHTVTLKDVKEAVKTLPPQLKAAPFGEIFEPLALRLVDMKLILDAAKASGLEKEKTTVKKLEDVRSATLHKAFLDKKVVELVNDAMLKTKYQELMKLLPKNQMEVRLRHVMVKTKEEAEEVFYTYDIEGKIPGKKFVP
jgi:hypothetical protein